MRCSILLDRHLRRVLQLVVSLILCGYGQTSAQEVGNFSGSLSQERNRDAEQTLELAKDHLAAQEFGAAVRHLQRVLDTDQDSLVLEGGTFRSAWAVADDCLSRLSPSGREAYVRSFGQTAAEELARANQSGSEEAMRRVARRFRLTEPGQQAILFLLMLALDRGEADVALGWSRVLDSEDAKTHFSSLNERLTKLITGSSEAIADPFISQESPKATWQVEMSVASEVQKFIAESLSDLNAQAIAPLLSAKPLVHEGRVFARQGGRLLAVDGATGSRMWEREIDSLMLQFTQNAAPQNGMWRATAFVIFLERLTRTSLFDQLSTDGERLFAILPTAPSGQESEKFVVRNSLAAFSLDDGKLLWTAGEKVESPSTESADDSPLSTAEQLTDVYFLSSPLAAGRWRLVLGQKDSKVWLLALEPSSGQLAWSVPLGQVVRTLEEDKSRQGTAARIIVRRGRAFCATAAGSVSCVDILTRRLLWSVRYPRDDIAAPVVREQSGRVARDLLQQRRLPTQNVWLDVSLHWTDGRLVVASPDSDRLYVLDAETGQMVWTRPRGQGLFVTVPNNDRLVVIGKQAATAFQLADGHELWTTRISPPGGQGFLTGTEYVLPLLNGGLSVLDMIDGAFSVRSSPPVDSATVELAGRKFSFSYGPPSTLQPVEPQNLVHCHGGAVSQTFNTLSVITSWSDEKCRDSQALVMDDNDRNSAMKEQMSPRRWAVDGVAVAGPVRPAISKLHPTLAALDAAVRFAESLIPQLESPHVRTAALVHDLAASLHEDDRTRAGQTLARLRRQPLAKVFLTDDDSGQSVRVDRWLEHGLNDVISSQITPNEATAWMMSQIIDDRLASDDATSEESDRNGLLKWENLLGIKLWGTASPSIKEAESPLDTLYVNTVPLTVNDRSPWEWVTVQVDRPGRNVLLHRADQMGPVIIPLPNTSSNARMMTDLLHGWVNGPLLCLRIGTEFFGFHIDQKTGRLPQSISWPTPEADASLIAGQSVNLTDLQDISSSPPPLWDDSQTGYYDLFGRPFLQVGPVAATCVCYWDRGHLRAFDPLTGSALWSRFSYPVGTHCVGDETRLAILRPDTNTVEVLRSHDGQTVNTWNLQNRFDSLADILSQVIGVNGTSVLTHSLPQQGESRSRLGNRLPESPDDVTVSVVDISTGDVQWSRPVSLEAWAFRVDDQFIGLIEFPERLTLLDWQSGREVAVHPVTLPATMTSVDVITQAEQSLIAVSTLSNDGSIFTTQQLQNSRRRPLVNGWLYAVERRTGQLAWKTSLENIGLPLDQPRHVPLLVASYSKRTSGSQIPTGVLGCLDIRSGNMLYEQTRANHVYHSFQSDITARRVELQLRQQVVTFDYSAIE